MLKHLIFLFGFSTFVVIVWITTSIYHNSVTSKITPANQQKIIPINAVFDTETLDLLEKREKIRVNLSERASVIEEAVNAEIAESSTESAIIEESLITP